MEDDTDNDERANRVAAFVEQYLLDNFNNPGDRELFGEASPEGVGQVEMVVGDMISDLGHYVDSRGGDGAAAIGSGERHHEAETSWIVTFKNGDTDTVWAHDEDGVRRALVLGAANIDTIEWGGY